MVAHDMSLESWWGRWWMEELQGAERGKSGGVTAGTRGGMPDMKSRKCVLDDGRRFQTC